MPRDPIPPDQERPAPSDYEPPAADEIAREDNVGTAGILGTTKDTH